MGADIYLESIYEKARKKYEPRFNAAVGARDLYHRNNPGATLESDPEYRKLQDRVDETYGAMYGSGYYRDPYNPSGLFQVIGISWWRDVVPMCDDEGYLPIENARKLVDMIEVRPVSVALVEAYLTEHRDSFARPVKIKNWLKRWQDDHRDLLALLNRSIELNEPLRCSL